MSAHLAGRLNYAKGERDMILMRHEVTVNLKDVCNKIRGVPTVHLNVVDTRWQWNGRTTEGNWRESTWWVSHCGIVTLLICQMLKPIMRKFAINLHHAYEQEKYQHSKWIRSCSQQVPRCSWVQANSCLTPTRPFHIDTSFKKAAPPVVETAACGHCAE